jgi:hypothetical protein
MPVFKEAPGFSRGEHVTKHRDQYGKTPGFKEAVHEAWIAARLLLARIEKD